MARSNTKIMVSSDTVVDQNKVATFTSTITVDTTEITVTSRYPSSELYEDNKEVIEADRDEFVAYVRRIQSNL